MTGAVPSRAALVDANRQLADRLRELSDDRRIQFTVTMDGRKRWQRRFSSAWNLAAARFARAQDQASSGTVISFATRRAEAAGHCVPESLELAALSVLAAPPPDPLQMLAKLRLFALMADLPDPLGEDHRATPAGRALRALAHSFMYEDKL